jgi:hypothetical protein
MSEQSMRPEMKGPSDISDLLSGLKTMSVNMPTNNNGGGGGPPPPISVKKSSPAADAKPIAPKTPRKQKSDKNTISLDM